LPEAEADIREAFFWYRDRSAIAANGFRIEVLAMIEDLAHSARIWAHDEDGIHRRVMRRFPYTVHYEVMDSLVTVLAVAHHNRLPGYWRNR
jgi:plasmid stabilization system protein ParE